MELTIDARDASTAAGGCLSTARFAMTHGAMARRLVSRHGLPWIGAMAAVAAAFAAAGIAADLRWAVVALMVVCIVAPMVMALLYFSHGLRPACVVNVLPHTLTLGPDALTASVWPRAVAEGDDCVNDSAPEPEPTVRRFEYAWLCPYTVGMDSVTVPLSARGGGGFLWIPAVAFERPGDFAAFMQTLSDRMADSRKKQ